MSGKDIRLRLLFGQFLQRVGKANSDQVRQAVRIQADMRPSLAETAVLEGRLTLDQLRQVREHQRDTGTLLEDVVVVLKMLTREDVAQLKERTKDNSMPLGETLVLMGVITEDDLREQLQAFHEYNDGALKLLPATAGV